MVIVECLIICAFKTSCRAYMVLFIIGYLMILERDTIYGTGVACIFSSVLRKGSFCRSVIVHCFVLSESITKIYWFGLILSTFGVWSITQSEGKRESIHLADPNSVPQLFIIKILSTSTFAPLIYSWEGCSPESNPFLWCSFLP